MTREGGCEWSIDRLLEILHVCRYINLTAPLSNFSVLFSFSSILSFHFAYFSFVFASDFSW